MPELPDLQIYSENLKKMVLNKGINLVTIYEPNNVGGHALFCKTLTGTSIEDIVRDGKELRFLLANRSSFNVHLMLYGKFIFTGKDEAEKTGGKIAVIFLEDRESLIISENQGRKICKVTLNREASTVPDALSDTFTFEYFTGKIKRSVSRNIKDFLIDQKIVRGIGNAYVDEILFEAGISPESAAGKIPEEKLKGLYRAIPSVLNDAIQNIRKISPDIISGEERSFLKVHNSRKKYTDDGEKIIVKTIASKYTCFTGKQELFV